MQNCLAVILAAGRGSRMYPLTEECPKCLLPLANRPLIWYPVQLLERAGFQEAVVVVRDAESRAVLDVLNQLVIGMEGVHLAFSLVQIPDGDDWGTADSLRFMRGKLKPQHNDVLVVSCDLVTSVPVQLLTDFHSCHHSTLTCLLSQPPPQQEDTHRKSAAAAAECDIIGLTAGQQLVYFAAQADLDDCLSFSKAMLKRHPHIRVSSQLTDAHLYLMKRWVLDFLADNKSFSSVKGELIPHLVRHQWMQAVPNDSTAPASTSKQALQMHSGSCVDKTEQLALQLSSFAGYSGHSDALTMPLLACHALEVAGKLCLRVNSISSYMEAHKVLSQHTGYFQTNPQMSQRSKSVSSDCVLGEGVQLGERVSVKHCAVGRHCHIGDRSKITNTVMMDHVSIGEGVSLQGCVVCSHVHVEDKVSLKDCLVGANFTVTRDADLKGETLVSGGGLHF